MDMKVLKEIIQVFDGSQVTKLELEIQEIKLKLEKNSAIVKHVDVINETKQEVIEKEEVMKSYVKSPLVGTFYEAPSEGEEPFVKVGSYVKEGDVLCIIEAMKVMNELKAPKAGYVTDIKVKNGQMVQFDEDLILIEDSL